MSADDPYMIIGAGQAGAWVARTLRDEGFDGDIVMIGDEPYVPYERPPLSKAVLQGQSDFEDLTIMARATFEDRSIDLWTKSKVDAIDPYAKKILLNDKSIKYHTLFLCAGGRARRLNFDDAICERILTLRGYDDACALKKALQPGARLGVIGGGWIGLEVAASARAQGCEVVVIEAADRVCARSLPHDAAAWLQDYHEHKGVRIFCGTSVEAASRSPDGCVDLMLTTGEAYKVDLLITAIGMIPNDDIALAAGLDCDNGVIVDKSCQTSVPGIFGAGDMTVLQSARYQRCMRFESWQNAQDQAIAAAKSALGLNVSYDPIPKMWSEQYDLMIRAAGVFNPSDEIEMYSADNEFLCVGMDKAGLVNGVASVNLMRDHRYILKSMEKNMAIDRKRLFKAGRPLTDPIVT